MPQPVLIEISARHAHVSQKDLEVLFGKGATLSKLKDLSQPGQFAANECVNVTGPGGTIEKVRILGPVGRDIALRAQRFSHAFAVIDVHLATEGLDEQFARDVGHGLLGAGGWGTSVP